MLPYCGPSVYKPPQMTKIFFIYFKYIITPLRVYLDYVLNLN
jgi:hypothetical protein